MINLKINVKCDTKFKVFLISHLENHSRYFQKKKISCNTLYHIDYKKHQDCRVLRTRNMSPLNESIGMSNVSTSGK